MQIVVGDIGGTHARFALARIAEERVVALDQPVVLATADFAGLADAYAAFATEIGQTLPRYAAFGVAGPVAAGPVHFINSHWVIDPNTITADLCLDSALLINDFGAMAHAVHALDEDSFVHICGPDVPLPAQGAISVIGPGTGLGVAVLQRRDSGVVVLETEGAHVHFAPLNERERQVCAAITARHGRTAIERIVSGPGLGAILRCFQPADTRNDAALWEGAISGTDPALNEALALLLASYGAAVGDLSLAHGAFGVVLTGGLTNRLRPLIGQSQFHARFCAKGRYQPRMESIPVKLITHPQPGLFGAAAAFAQEHSA